MSKFPSRVSVSAIPDRGVTGAFEISLDSEKGKRLLHSKVGLLKAAAESSGGPAIPMQRELIHE